MRRQREPASRARTILPVLALLLGFPAALFAQAQATSGVIRGSVVDPGGAPVAGAQVDIVHDATGLSRSVETNASGVFAATQLPVGSYDLRATSAETIGEVVRNDVVVRLGETVDLELRFAPIEAEEIVAVGEAGLIDPTDVTASQRFSSEVVEGLPNNGRNFLNYMQLTPGVKIVQGPDGDEITVSGQRGIFNNVIVDGADFNNPFFGEQRGGQRPAFTFNLDAVEEIVIVNQGATAEFGRSSSGFVNVLTKSGTNELQWSGHYFGQRDELSADFARGGGNPDFNQHQFGLTIGGPLKKDKAFFFLSYDQQEFEQTKQETRPWVDAAEFARLQSFLQTQFGGALRDDFGPIDRTDDSKAFLAKIDIILNDRHNASIKYNFTDSEQINGTFDVDFWGRSANALERDHSHSINGSLHSQLTSAVSNELRVQWAREDRPRPYEGPEISPGRPFPDTAMSFANNVRFGMPFFIPIEAYDWRLQALDNVSILRGNHLYKIGGEFNYTEANQTFIGFANGRFIFSSVDGFINYVTQGPRFVDCGRDADGSFVTSNPNGVCPAGTHIIGPLLLYLQQAPVPPVASVEEAGTQSIPQKEIAFFAQDEWKPNDQWTINYGVRYEVQIQPDVLTPPDEVFFAPFIGQTRNGIEFPSDGEIPTDWDNVQPRLGITWDVDGDGERVVRGNTGLFYARTPGLIFASTRSTNGSIGQTLFRASFFNGFGVTPPAFNQLINTAGTFPDHPDVFVTHKDFENPRTWSSSIEYEQLLTPMLAGYASYTYARTDHLFRFINGDDAVFGSPWDSGLPARPGAPTGPNDNQNGIGNLTVLESTAKSRYHGVTLGLKGSMGSRIELEGNYTLSFDKSDDDNERDPFTFRYARADRLDREFNWSDRDQRHRFNAYVLARLPWQLYMNNTITAASAQPTSEKCVNNRESGERAATPQERICANGDILLRNTLRRDNAFFSWDVRVSRPFTFANGTTLEGIVEVFNVFNRDNFLDSSPTSLLFNFDGTIRAGLGDPRRVQLGLRLKR